MRIGMILPGRFPPDIRVEKEIDALQDTHDIFLLCLKRDGQPEREKWQSAEIHRAFTSRQRWQAQISLMRRCRSLAWTTRIQEFIASVRPDALHVHDLPLAGAAFEAASQHRIPVIIDLHENYPAMLEVTLKVPLTQIVSLGALASRLSVSVDRWTAYEAAVVPRAHRVITVVDEARHRLLKLGASPEKVCVVGNYASMDADRSQDRPTADTHHGTSSRLRVVYAGAFGPTRDLATVLEAINRLSTSTRSAIDVRLIGGRGRILKQLRRHADTLRVSDCVEFLPWLPRREAEQLMTEADIGLVPHVKSPHTDATVPHKLFQYMWRRLPVVVSDCAPLARIVQETGCGLAYRSGDADSLARCLEDLHGRPDRGADLGDAGHSAVADRYNWNAAGKTLLDLYRDL